MKTKNENQLNITCPNCKESFSPTEAIWNELKNSMETELNTEISVQRAELEKEKAHVHKLTFKLNSEKEKLEELVSSKLKNRENVLRKELEEQINAEKAEELQLLEDSLSKKTKQLAEHHKMKRQMMILQEESELKELEIINRYEEKMNDAMKQIKEQSSETHQLELGQKNKIINDLQKQLEEASNKVNQYSSSGQFIGESAEFQLETLLQETFPQDTITPISVGARGADIIMEIKTMTGACIGKILYESKVVQRFDHNWLKKLKDDNASVGARALVLVTKVMPKEFEGQKFGIIDDVFICNHSTAKELAILLRYSILKINQVMLTYKGKETKQQMLFEWLTSPDFKNIYERVLNQLDALRSSHEAEKKKLIKLWSEREKMLEIAIGATVELFGNLQGITGGELPEIKSLEIDLPKAG